MTPVSPYFHPTTTVLIDDNLKTLRQLVQSLGLRGTPYSIFNNPHEGLDFINKDQYRETFVDKLSTSDESMEGDSLSFNPRHLVPELKSADRFGQISVLVVDYEMPGIKGLDLCEKIENPFIKKILLTGVADENIAVEAFNKGMIDRYVRKHDPEFPMLLQQIVPQVRHKYFQELFHFPLQTLRKRPESTALVDPVFITEFNRLVTKHHIQEYYLVEGTGSFLMIGADKKLYSLITLDEGLIDAYLNSKSRDTLTPEKIKSLEKRELMPCYYNPFRAPYLETDNLKNFLRKPTVLKGHQKTFYCVFGQGYIDITAQDITTWHHI